jgi:uncharacterized protein YceH (UPF0502 family)
MEPMPAADVPAHPSSWPALTVAERRVLGVLVEKAKTTPDVYPLSLNALVTGANQKSNRDPILNLSEDEVGEALQGAQKKGLAIKITGGRVERWRHHLYEAMKLNKVELAVLGELLLRGPQTEGELRSRASRMEPIDDLDSLREVLRPMAERRLVIYVTPEGRRGTIVTHGLHIPEELERLRADYQAGWAGAETAESSETRPPADRGDVADEARHEIATLRAALTDLQSQVAALAEQMRKLGGTPPPSATS